MFDKILLILIAIFGIYLYNSIDANAKAQIFKATYEIPAKAQQFCIDNQISIGRK